MSVKRPRDTLSFTMNHLFSLPKGPKIVGWKLTSCMSSFCMSSFCMSSVCLCVCAEMVDFEDIEGLRSRAGETLANLKGISTGNLGLGINADTFRYQVNNNTTVYVWDALKGV